MKKKKKTPILINPDIEKAVKLINSIGIETQETDWSANGFFQGVYICEGKLVYNPYRVHVGDLLHEAAHVAVMPTKLRPLLNGYLGHRDFEFREAVNAEYLQHENSPQFIALINAGEDAAIAWSYCAAKSIGIDPAILFEQGFPGDTGEVHLRELNESVRNLIPKHVGVSMLHKSGMLLEPKFFPFLSFWLQPI